MKEINTICGIVTGDRLYGESFLQLCKTQTRNGICLIKNRELYQYTAHSAGKFSVLWGGNFLLLRVEVFVGIIQFRPLKLNPPTLAIPSHCFCKWRLNIPVNKENEKKRIQGITFILVIFLI